MPILRLGAGTGLMVKSTGLVRPMITSVMIKNQTLTVNDDINDFNSRYRIGNRTANNSNTNDDGDYSSIQELICRL